jgi:hypothetical protein
VKFALLVACAPAPLLLWACASAPRQTAALPIAPHRDEILATVDAFFLALASSDAEAITALHSPGAVNVIAEPEKGASIRYRPVSEMIERMRSGAFPKFRESYWDPVVLERGGLAVVWTPYAIDKDGVRLHCGVDIFNLSKHGKTWKIDSLNFTMEPSACGEINPGEGAIVRPDF